MSSLKTNDLTLRQEGEDRRGGEEMKQESHKDRLVRQQTLRAIFTRRRSKPAELTGRRDREERVFERGVGEE